MRIPLDYYRILGLPIQATSEQLRQTHRDRTLQLPRREYSDAAIAARKQLLDQAYAVLSNPEQRQTYDTGFLTNTYELPAGSDVAASNHHDPAAFGSPLIDPHTPNIEIEDEQFIGALLILQELGEYELVLKLGRPFLTGGSASLNDRSYGDPTIVFSDIVLTVAFACLELGREQWQQGQYENAAEALETGEQLLLREGLFVNVRGEIQSDLFRLRPYRILELLASPEERVAERRIGMELLGEMLNERGGIDGTENDQSGLNVDDFLKFIQQLRSYLTAEEQQYLFEQEASRPSAVATYLTVYALLARGFAERQPSLVQQARQYLSPLNNRQDVHLESSICSLLLGQTEEASQALELSQEQDSIAFIRQHSQHSPDLLPGLCLYTERWFHDEVFPHFRDLADYRISLKDYFADRHVQTYLEALPQAEVERSYSDRSPMLAEPVAASRAGRRFESVPANAKQVESEMSERADYFEPDSLTSHDALIETAKARIASRGATATLDSDRRFTGGVSTAERVAQSVAEEEPNPTASRPRTSWFRPRVDLRGDSDSMPPRKMGDRPTKPRSAGTPGWLLPASALLGIVLLGLLGTWVLKALQAPKPPAPVDEKPLVQLDKSLFETPGEATDPTTVATIDKAIATQLIETWLAAKSKAMGTTYDVTAIEQILTDPKLTEWRNAAEEAKRDGWYRTYKHAVVVESVELLPTATDQATATPLDAPAASPTPTATLSPSPDPNATTPSPLDSASPAPETAVTTSPSATIAAPTPAAADQAKVTANVTEGTETFRNGKADGAIQTEQLRIQYTLVRKDGKWKIQDWVLQ